MCLWAIVPVKPLRRGKSRLVGFLSDEEREQLNHDLLVKTLRTLNEVPEIENTLVVSRDPAALSIARDYKVRTVLEDGKPELNTALRRATAVAQIYATCGVLILPADLPLITPDAICDFLGKSGDPPEVVIAPDRRGSGTNALLTSPTGLIQYRYGPDSFNHHVQQAKESGASLKVVNDPILALDLDLPEDIAYLKQVHGAIENLEITFPDPILYMEAK